MSVISKCDNYPSLTELNDQDSHSIHLGGVGSGSTDSREMLLSEVNAGVNRDKLRKNHAASGWYPVVARAH